MKTLVKTLDATINNDSIMGINELRVYVPKALPIINTGFRIKVSSAQTFKIVGGGYFTNSDSENLGTTKEVSANTDTLVVVTATSEDCYLVIPNRFRIYDLFMRGILNNYCYLPFFKDDTDYIGVHLLNVIISVNENGQVHTKYLSTSTNGIALDVSAGTDFLIGDIKDINGKINQIKFVGQSVYGDIAGLDLVPNANSINCKDAQNIYGSVESIANKLVSSAVNYPRTCYVNSNGSITYNGEAVPYGKTATISIDANSNTYTVAIS